MDIKKSKNRKLVIIGNGFDLAHNLSTSYKQYFEYIMNDFFQKSHQKMDFNENDYFSSQNLMNYDYSGIDSFLAKMGDFSKTEKVKVKNQFFYNMLKANLTNWVDVESFYYNELLLLFINRNDEHIKILNDEFEIVKSSFVNYLKKTVLVREISINESISKIINENIIQATIEDDLDIKLGYNPIHVLNFNYTYTIEKYTEGTPKSYLFFHNNIHGKLSISNEKIIFGYGDESDNNYSDIESVGKNEYLKHFKSFGYFKAENYKELLKFIDYDKYDFFILGHSCGLSDRVMLKTIFEHINCEKIQIFYHQYGVEETENDFINKTMEISRHFSNKADMRKKVVSFEKSIPLIPFKANQI